MQTNNTFKKKNNNDGFALLLTLLIVTILISIGVSVLNLSVKQIKLASNAKDSEVAFHAANAGLECGLFWRRTASTSMETNANINPGCFTVFPSAYSKRQVPTSRVTGGVAYQYKYEFTWGTPTRCSQINTMVGIADINQGGLVISSMDLPDMVPGYPDNGSNQKTCDPGTKCSVISVKGYNKPCGSVNDYGTVQREVLLQL